MDKTKLKELESDIEDAMELLAELQKKYHEQTGRDFIKPLRLAPRKLSITHATL